MMLLPTQHLGGRAFTPATHKCLSAKRRKEIAARLGGYDVNRVFQVTDVVDSNCSPRLDFRCFPFGES